MRKERKPTHTSPGGTQEDDDSTEDGIVNDSLGTSDPADSTGTDENREHKGTREQGNEKGRD